MHSHSKLCPKYKIENCHYNFEKFFADRTTISLPLQDDLSEDVKRDILNKRERVLSKVKENSDNNLNTRIRNTLIHITRILRKIHQ